MPSQSVDRTLSSLMVFERSIHNESSDPSITPTVHPGGLHVALRQGRLHPVELN